MPFDSGTLSFRLFYLQRSYTSAVVDDFARRTAPPITTLERDPISGWVSGRHLFDRDITDAKCVTGPYLHVQLMKAEKKIPASLLRAYVKQEEDVAKTNDGTHETDETETHQSHRSHSSSLSRKAKAPRNAKTIRQRSALLLKISNPMILRLGLLHAGNSAMGFVSWRLV